MEKTGVVERTVIYVNPAAGGGRAGRVWAELEAAMPEVARARLVLAGDPRAASAELNVALGEPIDRVIALGGDGTLHVVANRLLETGCADRVALGLVPAGTGSDVARLLGLPRDPAEALRRALGDTPRPLDAIAVATAGGERRYVVNVFSAGISGLVGPAVNAIPDRGPAAYLVATLSALLRYQPATGRVLVDGEPLYRGPFFLVAVANGVYFGKGMKVAPLARLDDGLADVVVIGEVPRWQLPLRLLQFLTGRHLGLPFVHFKRGKTARLEPESPLGPLDLDGENVPASAADFTVLPAALRILA